MDDVTPFDRQIAAELMRDAGPSERVDDAAIFAAITTATQSPKWRVQTMFGAAKLAVATAIVALFGGFLLLSTPPADDGAPAAVTESPAPTTTEELLSRMVTEEVEPGVFRILDDGAGHDLVAEPPGGLTVAPDGSVWLLRALAPGGVFGWATRVNALMELGVEGAHELAQVLPDGADAARVELAVDADGVVWIDAAGDLVAFDGSQFTHEAAPAGIDGLARWLPEGVARLIDGEWVLLDEPNRGGFAAGGGTAWSAPALVTRGHAISRYDGRTWEAMELPAKVSSGDPGEFDSGPMAVGPDGTVWVYLDAGSNSIFEPYLARYSDDSWHVYGADSGVPILEWHTYASHMAVDGDGRVWIAPGNGDGWPAYLNDVLGAADRPVGVLAFDGERWTRFLDGIQVNGVAVAADGMVFATGVNGCTRGESAGPEGYACPPEAMDPGPGGLYAITAEAMAVTQSAPPR
jgi:hypothetical protein